MSCSKFPKRPRGFTLIELLVVISIVVVLIGLAFPAYQGVQNAAKKTQAKNDLVQIVTAVNAFYTEYGRYPTTATADTTVGGTAGMSGPVFDELRGITTAPLNTRKVVFLSPPEAKDQTDPRSGIKTADGQFYDPFGTPYTVAMDADYDNQITNPYTADTGAGGSDIRQGVIAWSLGKDRTAGTDKNVAPARDDVISWQ